MRKFMIKVNGNSYEVEVEELAAVSPAPVAHMAPAAMPTPGYAGEAANTEAKIHVPEGATEVHSPLPGTILSLQVSVGDTVSRGDVLVMIEAMKMENEIMSPRDGRIISIAASKDDTVNTGDLILVIG